jgi:hypothetical protein
MPQAQLERWLLRAVILLIGAGSALMGAALILGGPGRFGSPSFATARLSPGEVYTWGVLILAAGAATLLGAITWRRRLVEAGCLAMAFWYLFFDVSIITISFPDPHGAVTGAVVYSTVTGLCFLLFHAARNIRDPRTGR